MKIWWDGEEHSDDENFRWTWLRAAEWSLWPVFIAQPFVPFLLLLDPTRSAAWRVVAVIIVVTWLWKLVRYHWVSVRLADLGCWFVHLKWLSSVLAGVFLFSRGRYEFALLAALWPLVTLVLMPLCGGGMVGIIQKKLLLRLGYVPLIGDWNDCLIADFHRPATSTNFGSAMASVDQRSIDRILRWGIVFSLLWFMGFGSAIAVVNGLRARRLIERSNGRLAGVGRTWWCLVVGGLGLTIWIPLVIVGIFNAISKSAVHERTKYAHAASPAPSGWYLIIPPVANFSPTQVKAFPQAPLSKWHTMDAFDSVADCEQALDEYRSVRTETLQINPRAYHLGSRPKDSLKAREWDGNLRVLKSALGDAVHGASCIASDDPRLKGN